MIQPQARTKESGLSSVGRARHIYQRSTFCVSTQSAWQCQVLHHTTPAAAVVNTPPSVLQPVLQSVLQPVRPTIMTMLLRSVMLCAAAVGLVNAHGHLTWPPSTRHGACRVCLRACVPACLRAWRAWRACVLACLRACVPGVPACAQPATAFNMADAIH